MVSKVRISTYLARSGDTLQSIATAGQVAIGTLKAINPQIVGEVDEGDFVNLPWAAASRPVHLRLAQVQATHFQSLVGDPAWLLLAQRELGQKAVEGPANNHRIIEYLHSVESLNPGMANSDETDWCSCFVNWCMEKAGLVGTDKPNAQSWKNWRTAVAGPPRRGDVAVFQRWASGEMPSWKGHVGFWLSQSNGEIELLGGNQGRSVSVRRYPVNGALGSSNYRLIGLRRP